MQLFCKEPQAKAPAKDHPHPLCPTKHGTLCPSMLLRVSLSMSPLPPGSLKVYALHGISSPICHPCRKGRTSRTPHSTTCHVGTLTLRLDLPWAESPGWFLQAQATQRSQCLLFLPKIVVFKSSGRKVKMFLITKATFGVSFLSLIEPVERDPWISGRFGLDWKIVCVSKRGTKTK